jgi:hypothetical protein
VLTALLLCGLAVESRQGSQRNETHKHHQNGGLKRKRAQRYTSQKGMDPKFLRNLR